MRRRQLAGMVAVAIAWGFAGGTHGAEEESGDGPSGPGAPGHVRAKEMSPDEVLTLARGQVARVNRIKDYCCTLVKREGVGGKLGEYTYVYMKVRHDPFSVYTYHLRPPVLRGREVVYVEGKNNNRAAAVRCTCVISEDGHLDQRCEDLYDVSPDFRFHLKNVAQKLVDTFEQQKESAESEVTWLKGAKINKRPCALLQIVYPVQRKGLPGQTIRIFIDDELDLLTRLAVYDWPEASGGKRRLVEEYTYLDLKLNNGFTDFDFPIPKRRATVDKAKRLKDGKAAARCRPCCVWPRRFRPFRRR